LERDEAGALRQGAQVDPDSAPPVENREQSLTLAEPGAGEAGLSREHDQERDTGWVDERLKSILESLLFVAGEPVSLSQLANALEEVPREQIRRTLSEMAAEYTTSGRGVALEEIAGGYQLRTPSKHAVYVRRLLSAKPPRLSRAVLETLAIVAYRQPITRPEIEQLRGVDSGGVLDTLIDRILIKIVGRKDAPGRPIMYATTPEFLQVFGLKDLESLPDLEEFRELEGSHDPAEPAASAGPAEPVHNAELPEAQAPAQTILNEPPSDPAIGQSEETLHQASASDTAQSDAPGLPANTKKLTKAEHQDEPEDPH
jgi:segregation and condensation protein B